jgi:hypothetical protein
MTVSRHRRRMTTTRAVVASLVGVALALGLGAAGYVAIANTTDGQEVGDGTPEVRFPTTPTAALAVVDDAGDLSSLAVVTVRPGVDDDPGRGGSIVPVPISADSSGGFGTERLPLNETVALFGAEALADEVPVLLGVGIDDVLVVDQRDLAGLLAAIGSIDVDLPQPVTDRAGRELFPAGPQSLSADEAAVVLSASDPRLTGADRYPIDVAVWHAISDAVGEGLELPAVASGGSAVTNAPEKTGSIEVVERLTSGPIAVQPLRSTPIVSLDRNPRGVDAVALDRAEVVVIFGHIAPGKVAAPNPGYNFRVVSRFADDQLRGGASRLDVAYTATEALLDGGSNVISVDTAEGEAAAATLIEVSDESLVAAAQSLSQLFGPIEVRVADTRIAGVDVVVTLGTEYLARLDTDSATPTTPGTAATAGSGSVASESTAGTTE